MIATPPLTEQQSTFDVS